MRNKSPYVLLSACPISDQEKNGDGPDERNAESNGMIEGGRLFNGLPRNFLRLIRIAWSQRVLARAMPARLR
jgi:hypothetical protein